MVIIYKYLWVSVKTHLMQIFCPCPLSIVCPKRNSPGPNLRQCVKLGLLSTLFDSYNTVQHFDKSATDPN